MHFHLILFSSLYFSEFLKLLNWIFYFHNSREIISQFETKEMTIYDTQGHFLRTVVPIVEVETVYFLQIFGSIFEKSEDAEI